MPRSNPPSVAASERDDALATVIWDRLEWWHRDYTGERVSNFKKTTFRPLALVDELDRRVWLSQMDDRTKWRTFYDMEVEGHVWQPEFDELHGNYLNDEQRRIDALVSSFTSPFPAHPAGGGLGAPSG